MSGFSKIPPKWELTYSEKIFLLHSANESVQKITLALQTENIELLDSNIKFLDAVSKQLNKNKLAKFLIQNPIF